MSAVAMISGRFSKSRRHRSARAECARWYSPIAARQDGVDEPSPAAVVHRHCHGAVQLDHWRRTWRDPRLRRVHDGIRVSSPPASPELIHECAGFAGKNLGAAAEMLQEQHEVVGACRQPEPLWASATVPIDLEAVTSANPAAWAHQCPMSASAMIGPAASVAKAAQGQVS